MKNRMLTHLLAFSIGLINIQATFPCFAKERESHQMSINDVEYLAKSLRKEIDLEYSRLVESKNLSLPNTGKGNDISFLVSKYLPLGTSFQDAENILMMAGFQLADSPPRPARAADSAYDRFNIRGARILEQRVSWRAEVVIILTPETSGDPLTKVKKVYSAIITSSI